LSKDEKSKKVADELRDEQDKVVKDLLGEMGLTSKEVDTILTTSGGLTTDSTTRKATEESASTETPSETEPTQQHEQAQEPLPEEAVASEPTEEEVPLTSPGIEGMFKKLDEMANTVSTLERGIAASLSAELLQFRQELVDLRTEIAAKLTERLRMKAFAPLVENAIAEVVVSEVKKLEERLLESFSKDLVGKFRGFREELTGSKYRLLASIKEQAEIYGAHGRSLEDELSVREKQIKDLKQEVTKRDIVESEQRATISELESNVVRMEKELSELAGTPRTGQMELNELKARVQSQQSTIERLRSQMVETSEIKAKLKAYEDDVEEKRKRLEEESGKLAEVEGRYAELEVRSNDYESQTKSLKQELERLREQSADAIKAKGRAIELEAAYDRAKQEVQDLRAIVEETEDKLQAKRAEVARVLKVMAKEPKYKILTILKDVGTLDINEIARAIGQPIAIAKRYSQELQQDGYVKIGDKNDVTGLGEWAKGAQASS
jgi:epidermal growth factor receptor substrate 15